MKKPLVCLACLVISIPFVSTKVAAQTIKESEQVQEFSRAMQRKQFSKAREIAASLAKAPSSSRVQLIAADLLLRSGDAEGAVKQFDAYVEKQPGEKPYLWQRGIALYFVGRHKEGVEQFNSAVNSIRSNRGTFLPHHCSSVLLLQVFERVSHYQHLEIG